ncbi:MAG: type II toxin-antitoxin system PemK/MazF family toxin [Pseudomonadales bacterium]|nr:type II toxin-antitoxin system PemK/MazF family toxin [Pseudomonadales bacterium]
MDRGDIWLVSLDPTSGFEQRGDSPVLIVSPRSFNELTKAPIALPITRGGSFARRQGFAISLENAGTRTIGVIRCDQPRALDLMARNGTKLETVSATLIDEVLARLVAILD